MFVDSLENKQVIEKIAVADTYTLWQSLRYINRYYKANAYVIVIETGERTLNYKLSTFPVKKSTRGTSWANIHDDKGARIRKALWVEIFKDGRWFYVVEREGKPKEFGIYVMQQKNGFINATDSELKTVMYEWLLMLKNE